MAVLTNKLIDGHKTPSRSINLGTAFPLARELLAFLRYLRGGPFAPLHSLSYLLIFGRGFLTAAHSLIPFGYRSGVIARHAPRKLTIGKDIFINIPVGFLYGESGEYPFEAGAATARTGWWRRRRVPPIGTDDSATRIAPILINRHFPLVRKF